MRPSAAWIHGALLALLGRLLQPHAGWQLLLGALQCWDGLHQSLSELCHCPVTNLLGCVLCVLGRHRLGQQQGQGVGHAAAYPAAIPELGHGCKEVPLVP